MDFLAVLDYDHLDNGVFLSSFAKSLSRKTSRGIVIHGDSEHTNRIMQTGVMREDARIRAIKELNHRLVALFADEGISTIALNGYQKSLITYDGSSIKIDTAQIQRLPNHPMLLISNLVLDPRSKKYIPLPLSKMAAALSTEFGIEQVTIFSMDDSSDIIKRDLPHNFLLEEADQSFIEKHIPDNLQNLSTKVRLKTASDF